MSTNRDVREAIKKIVGKSNEFGIACKVVAVNGYLCDVSPISGDADILDVRLQTIEGKGIYIVPKMDSIVYVSSLDSIVYYISLYSEISSIEFGGADFGGFVKVLELKENLDKNNQILQTLLSILTGPPIPEPGNGAPSALQTSLAGGLAGKQVGSFENIENEKIKHGDFS